MILIAILTPSLCYHRQHAPHHHNHHHHHHYALETKISTATACETILRIGPLALATVFLLFLVGANGQGTLYSTLALRLVDLSGSSFGPASLSIFVVPFNRKKTKKLQVQGCRSWDASTVPRFAPLKPTGIRGARWVKQPRKERIS